VDVQRAMRAHNERLPADRRIEFRIGINVGDIILDDNDIYGDGVNVAARLEGLSEPGGICVSKVVRDQVIDRLSFGFEHVGPQQVKNIARPVDVYRVDLDGVSRSASILRRFAPARHGWRAGVAAVAVACIAVAIAYTVPALRNAMPAAAPAMSVAVLPFGANGGSEQEKRFADDVTRDLAVRLGRTKPLRVTSLPLTNGYDGTSRDAGAARRDPRVRYLVHGDVRGVGNLIVVDAKVTDVASGKQLWADRFEGPPSGFDQRDGILLAQITRRAYEAVTDSEVGRAGAVPAANAPAIEYVLHGHHVWQRDPSALDTRMEAARWFDKALAIDPNLGSALVARIFTVFYALLFDASPGRAGLIDEVDQLTSRAIKLDQSDGRTWWLRGRALGYQMRWDAALDATAQAIRLDPTDMGAMGSRAELLMLAGRFDEAIAETERILQLLPANSLDKGWPVQTRCRVFIGLGRYDDGIQACEKAVANHDWWLLHVYLLAAYTKRGQVDKAAMEKTALLKLRHGFSIAEFQAMRLSDSPDWLLQHETRIYPELRKAGIPETPNDASVRSS
jgi:TolB-like protein